MSQSISMNVPPYTGRGKEQQQQHQQQRQQQKPQRQPLLQQQQQQQQRQRQRSRRPRSIHITLRKTRSGSRPVNIQRSQHPFAITGSGECAGSPTGASGNGQHANGERGAGAGGAAGYQLLDNDVAQGATINGNNHNIDQVNSRTGGGGVVSVDPLHISPNHVADTSYPQGRPSHARSYTDAAAGQHARVPSNGGGGSSSSSYNGVGSGGGASNASVGPSSGSGGAPSLQCVPQLNTFMKAPQVALQQLLPPGMRDRVNSNNSGNRMNVTGSPTAPAEVLAPFPTHSVGATAAGYGAVHRLRSRSQLYNSSSTLSPAAEAPNANTARLRSNSSGGQFDVLAGSYSSMLGDFVFPHPDRSTPLQQPRTPPAATAVYATPTVGNTTVNFDSRSPRLSPPATDHARDGSLTSSEAPPPLHPQQQQQHPRTRARSYTACGVYHMHRRSNNNPVITASMAGAGGAALFGGHTHVFSTSHEDSDKERSRNLDQSLSLSSSPAGFTGGSPALGTGASNSTMAHPHVNTSRSSLRSGTAAGVPQVLSVCATPPAQQRQPQPSQRPTLTPNTANTPGPLGDHSAHKSGSLVTHRSASSDMVNGLNDSMDTVLCGSTPRQFSASSPPPSGAATTCANRYVMDSTTSDETQGGGGGGGGVESRRPRRYSAMLTDDDEGGTTRNVAQMTTLDRLRSRRDGGGGGGTNNSNANNNDNNSLTRNVQASASHNGHRADHVDASAEPKTAIERWRAQEEQKRREEATRARQYRLSARQWREAFRRLEENRMKWTMRSFIGAGTSGKVYEGVLDDAAHTPVAVKVLDVGVPMPVGPGTASGGGNNMSPAQQEALLVLLREVEMMEKLHQENIVTCLRCQVTPVHDRFMELHNQRQQAQQQRQQRPSSQTQRGDDVNSDTVVNASGSPQCNSANAIAAATLVPVQVEIIMEFCKRGTLASVVRRSPGGQLPVVVARRYLRDVLKGLAYLHRNNFIHRDVKGENVLISADDVAKLADFGCSRRIVMTNSHAASECHDGTMSSLATTHATDSRYTTMADYQWCDATAVAQTMVGTPMFMAPEIIQASGAPPVSPSSVDSTERGGFNNPNGSFAAAATPAGYTASADIWSFGCLVLEVFGRTPWPSAGNNVYLLMKQIEQSVDDLPPGVPSDTPAELLNVLRCCFHRSPHRRSTARMLLRSTWMTCKDEELEEMPPRRRR